MGHPAIRLTAEFGISFDYNRAAVRVYRNSMAPYPDFLPMWEECIAIVSERGMDEHLLGGISVGELIGDDEGIVAADAYFWMDMRAGSDACGHDDTAKRRWW